VETSSEEDIPNINYKFEKEFLGLLASIKEKDPTIYNKSKEFFADDGHEDHAEDHSQDRTSKPQHQEEVKYPSDIEDFHEVLKNIGFAEGNAQQNQEQRYIEREMSKAEGLRQYLKGESRKFDDREFRGKMRILRDHWSDPNLTGVDRYLRDYILDKKYLQNEDDPLNDELRRMDELSADSEEEQAKLKQAKQKLKKSSSAPALPKPKYQFRFQEPDQEFLKRYPLQGMLSARKMDSKRIEKHNRQRDNRRKRQQQQKMELDKKKAAKRKEILAKLERMMAGREEEEDDDELDPDDLGYQVTDPVEHEDPPACEDSDFNMDADYDSEVEKKDETTKKKKKKKERKRKSKKSEGDDQDKIKTGDQDLNEASSSRGWMPPADEDEGPYYDDPDFNMDADYDPDNPVMSDDEVHDIKSKKGKKGKDKDMDEMFELDEAIAKAQMVLGPDNEELQNCVNDYYKLECEELVDGVPFRFKYRQVLPTNYGLTMDEILKADDDELKKWVPMEKILEFRPEQEEEEEIQKFKKKRTKINKRKKTVFHSVYGTGKKKVVPQAEPMEEGTSKTDQLISHLGITNDRYKAYGLKSLPRFKRWLAYDHGRKMDRNISGIQGLDEVE
jgi:protein KRI1